MKAKLKSDLEILMKEMVSPKRAEERVSSARLEKRKQIDLIKNLLEKYRTLAIIDLNRVPAKFLSYLRQKLAGVGEVRVFKNSLILIALKEMGYNVDEVSKILTGSNAAIFTNLNSFEIKILLDKIAMPFKAKPGDKIDREIVVPAMRTELKPGPVMSLFGKLKIPIQVRDGVIWIAKDSVIARPGDEVTPQLVSLFNALGIEPNFIRANIKVVVEGNLVFTPDKLKLDIGAYVEDIKRCAIDAINLASELVLPEPQIVRIAIGKAYDRALKLSIGIGLITKDTASIVFANAVSRALQLASLLAQKVPELAQQLPAVQQTVSAPVSSAQPESKAGVEEKESEEKKEVSEEQLAEGLSALFG